MRGLFTDGFNSFSHFGIGILSSFNYTWAATFIFYEILEGIHIKDENTCIDLTEFALGFIFAKIIWTYLFQFYSIFNIFEKPGKTQ